MPHGIDAYFAEIARRRRRVGWIGVAVAAALLAFEFALMVPPAVRTLNDPKRFGFEGPNEYVRRILLETVGDREQAGSDRRNLISIQMRAGGGKRRARTSRDGTVPVAKRVGVGPGQNEIDLQSRLRALALEGPVVRSEDLVVEKLVRPDYPEDARSANIEGVVEMMMDATQNYNKPLTAEKLFGWHAALFPTGYSGLSKIKVAGWRDDAKGPMQVVSGAPGR